MNESEVLVAVKTPLMRNAGNAVLPCHLTLPQAVKQLTEFLKQDPDSSRILQQLQREMGSDHDYIAISQTGQLTKVDQPNQTTLGDIAADRELRTKDGIEKISAAAFEIQSYAPVGQLIKDDHRMGLEFPIDDSLQLTFLMTDGIYALAKKGHQARRIFIPTQGPSWTLKRMIRFEDLRRRMRIRNRDIVEKMVHQKLSQSLKEKSDHRLIYFLCELLPAVAQRDVLASYELDEATCHWRSLSAFDDRFPLVHQGIPDPQWPRPSIMFRKRIWLLQKSPAKMKCWSVICNQQRLSLSGEFILQQDVVSCWEKLVQAYADAASQPFARFVRNSWANQNLPVKESQRSNAIQCGDLLLLDNSEYLGAIMDCHFNHELRRNCDRTLCLAAPFSVPAKQPKALRVFQLVKNRWQSYSPKKGFCLARAPSWHSLDTPGISLVCYLRAVARHFAQNGRFHE